MILKNTLQSLIRAFPNANTITDIDQLRALRDAAAIILFRALIKEKYGFDLSMASDALEPSIQDYLAKFENSPLPSIDLTAFDISDSLGGVYERVLDLEPKPNLTLEYKDTYTDRRKSGSHYTPPSLISEIVRPALEPIFRHRWETANQDPKRYNDSLLKLRILDPAMGGADFLIGAAREVTAEIAWVDLYGKPRHIANPDAHEPLTHPDPYLGRYNELKQGIDKYLPLVVSQTCFGVDISPIATELGKLALQLTCPNTDITPSLERNIRCGDALIGLFWPDVENILETRFGVVINDDDSLLSQLGFLGSENSSYDDVKHYLDNPTDRGAIEKVRWLFDLAVLGVFFEVAISDKTELEKALGCGDLGLTGWRDVIKLPTDTDNQQVLDIRQAITHLAKHGKLVNGRPLRAFHWPLVYPEPFDVIVTNPPFVGDCILGTALGNRTTKYLFHQIAKSTGTSDLAGFFGLRMPELVKSDDRSVIAAIMPKTLGQAKNREVVIENWLASQWVLFRASQSCEWPGQASVHVSLVWLTNHPYNNSKKVLKPSPSGDKWAIEHVPQISSFLDGLPETLSGGTSEKPLPGSRHSLFFTGTTFRGGSKTGKNFIKTGFEASEVLTQAKASGETNALSASYGNADLQNSRKIETGRLAIDFWSVLHKQGLLNKPATIQIKWLRENYPYLLSEISGTQKTRLALPDIPSNASGRTYWWLPFSIDASLRLSHKPVSYRIAVGAKATKIWALHKVPVFDSEWGLPSHIEDSLASCPFEAPPLFAVMQSILGEIHVRRTSATLQTSLRFSPVFALKGFPFPWASQWSIKRQGPYPIPPSERASEVLDPAITKLLNLRDKLLQDPETLLPEIQKIPNNWGITQLYNRYDDDTFTAPNIQLLRQAHIELLDAVLVTYASDPTLPQSGSMFENLRQDMAQSENNGWCFDHPWLDGTIRFVPAREFRDRIIETLLVANQERWEQEIRLIANKVQEVLHKHGYYHSKPNNLLQLALQNGIKIHKDDYDAVLQKLESQI